MHREREKDNFKSREVKRLKGVRTSFNTAQGVTHSKITVVAKDIKRDNSFSLINQFFPPQLD